MQLTPFKFHAIIRLLRLKQNLFLVLAKKVTSDTTIRRDYFKFQGFYSKKTLFWHQGRHHRKNSKKIIMLCNSWLNVSNTTRKLLPLSNRILWLTIEPYISYLILKHPEEISPISKMQIEVQTILNTNLKSSLFPKDSSPRNQSYTKMTPIPDTGQLRKD